MDPRPLHRATRAWLLRELDDWRREGLVDESSARAIAARYGEAPERVSGPVFAIYLIGSLLIGGGVLAFVGWNWDALPGWGKLALGGIGLTAANGVGFWLWKVDGRRPLLGHALVLLGSLLFGANIGIVSQVFQLDGEFWSAAGLWGGAALVAALLVRSVANGMLASMLGVVWAIGLVDDAEAWWPPLALAASIVPLAFWLRSPALFAVTAIASAIGLASLPLELGEEETFVTSLLATALLLAVTPWAVAREQRAFGKVALALATALFVALGYALSFHEVADEVSITGVERGGWIAGVAPQALLAIGIAVRALATRRAFGARRYGLVLVVATALLFVGTLLPDPEVPLAILANLALVLVAGWSIVFSLQAFERRAYWAGAALIGLVIVSRFVEYETGLLLEAIVFTLAGLAVIVFGLAFERRLRKTGPEVAS